MSRTSEEIASQPETWSKAVDSLHDIATRLPSSSERLALIGCGTSFYIAQSVAALRESAGLGESDAIVASEFSPLRPYDQVLAISRSGTTTEVVRALGSLLEAMSSLAITAVPGSPVDAAASGSIVLDYADERSVVQTRFATTTLALMRAHLGEDLEPPIADARSALEADLPVDPSAFERFVFLGHGWTVGLANEASLKMAEAALAWSSAYPAMEFRHGPISLADESTLVWLLGVSDTDLVRDVEATGATVVVGSLDPMAELVSIQRMAVALADARGLDPDRPRHLTRSVVLS
jgi:fructoselysine-6-P-deglycase FrlB-like protein